MNERLLAHHPQLAQPPSLEQGQGQGQAGIDAPLPPAPSIYWDRVGNVVPIPGTADDGEVAENEEERCRDTWEDWALYYGAEIMGELRAEVFKRLQYTCSAGIAHGKAFAKVSIMSCFFTDRGTLAKCTRSVDDGSDTRALLSDLQAMLGVEETKCPDCPSSSSHTSLFEGYGLHGYSFPRWEIGNCDCDGV